MTPICKTSLKMTFWKWLPHFPGLNTQAYGTPMRPTWANEAYIDILVQDCNDSIVNTLRLFRLQSCANPSIWVPLWAHGLYAIFLVHVLLGLLCGDHIVTLERWCLRCACAWAACGIYRMQYREISHDVIPRLPIISYIFITDCN